MKLTLERVLESNEGTFGLLSIEGSSLVLFTAEPQWRNNEHGVSCIPPAPDAGDATYPLAPHFSPREGYDTYEVTHVPNRGSILIHKGNVENDTEGCILVGLKLAFVNVTDKTTGAVSKKLAVVQSAPAYTAFMDALGGKDRTDATLTVRWAPGKHA